MVSLNNITGLVSSTLVITAAVTHLPGASCLRYLRFAMLVGMVALVVLIPIGGMPLAAYLRGWIGDLSITSLVLLTLTLLTRLPGRKIFDSKEYSPLFILVALAGLVLYPMALGIGYWDPYRLGLGNVWFLCGLLLLALAAYFYRLSLVTFIIVLAVLAWSIEWYESRNLWDYLLDPLLFIYVITRLVHSGTQGIFKSSRQ